MPELQNYWTWMKQIKNRPIHSTRQPMQSLIKLHIIGGNANTAIFEPYKHHGREYVKLHVCLF